MATITRMRGADAAANARGQINIPALPNFATTPAHLLLLRRSLLVASFDRIAIESDPVARSDLADISSEGGGIEWTDTAARGAVRGQRLFAPHIALPYDTGFTIAIALTMPEFNSELPDIFIATSDDWRNQTSRQGMMFRIVNFGSSRSLQFETATDEGQGRVSGGYAVDQSTRIYIGRFNPNAAQQVSLYHYASNSWDSDDLSGDHNPANPTAGVVLRSRADGDMTIANESDMHMYCQWDEPLSDSGVEAEAVRLADWLDEHGVEVERP